MMQELVEKSRSYRRFRQEKAVDARTLNGLIGLCRLIPSAGNRQPLKYVLSIRRRRIASSFRLSAGQRI